MLQSTFISNVASRPWWLHAGSNLLGRVLVSETVDNDSITSIRQLASEIVLLSSKDRKITFVNECNTPSKTDNIFVKFDAIIIDNLNTRTAIDLGELYSNYINENGIVLILEPNQYYFNSRFTDVKKWFLNLFINVRKKELNILFPESKISQFSSQSRDGSVRYSFKTGLYESNKNPFLLKEKIKSFIYRSTLSRIFHDSNLWLISFGTENNDLESFILKGGDVDENINMGEMDCCSGIFYKSGKAILTFKGRESGINNIVVVIALSETAISQRDNELKSINFLSKVSGLEKYFKSKSYKKIINGFNCYFMQQTPGITVDAFNKKLNKMTTNAYEVIVKLANLTQENQSETGLFEGIIRGYSHNIVARVPSSRNKVNLLNNFLISAFSNVKFPAVCLHGDMKLENFVLSENSTVEGVIDWELCELKSFPLLDLIYLIIYNYQSAFGETFNDIYTKLWKGELGEYQESLISEYCKEFNISSDDKILLNIVFFMHHYGQRFLFLENDEKNLVEFNRLLAMIVNDIPGN